MMTPKEKAEELVDLYYPIFTHSMAMFDAKKCALIAVNLLMEEAYRQHDYEGFISYWKEVKQEIQKL
jgi:hypothetical protein